MNASVHPLFNKSPKRILIKISGETLGGTGADGTRAVFAPAMFDYLVEEIRALREQTIEVSLCVGGGNIFRKRDNPIAEMDGMHADRIGMMATVLNGLALHDALIRAGMESVLFSSKAIDGVAAAFSVDDARRLAGTGHVLIFAGGTGNPLLTTDTASVIRSVEMRADMMLKATKVDGVYDKDPECYPEARKYPRLSWQEALDGGFKVMDAVAMRLALEQNMPIIVFSITERQPFREVVRGRLPCTVIAEAGA